MAMNINRLVNWPKKTKNTILIPQAMYFYQKLAKTSKIKKFPQITLPKNDSWQQS